MDPFIKKVKKRVTDISTFRLSFGNIAQGCTYCFSKEVKNIYLKIHNDEVIHDYQIALIASCLGRMVFLDDKLILYRLHEGNSVGFQKKNRKIEISASVSRIPFMYRFFTQINQYVKVKNLFIYKILYYCRIPYFRHILRRVILGA